MKKKTLSALLCCIVSIGFTQTKVDDYPKEGDRLSDYTFTDVINHNKEVLKLSDYKGSWLVIDWWAIGCTSCIASFPKMNKMKKDFEGRVKFIMVGESGKQGDRKGSKQFYLARQKKQDLSMTAAFDSASFERYAISSVPFILVVNPQGVIVSKILYIDSTQLEGFISGNKPPYHYAYSRNEKRAGSNYNFKLPLLATGKSSNGGNDTSVISRSVFAKWNRSMPVSSSLGFTIIPKQQFMSSEGKIVIVEGFQNGALASALGFDLKKLLKIAYTGKPTWTNLDSLYIAMYPAPVLETKKLDLFGEMYEPTGANMYSYSVSDKRLTVMKARKKLIEDLESTFGIRTSVERRAVLVWKLVVINDRAVSDLRTKGGEMYLNGSDLMDGFTARNISIDDFLKRTGVARSISNIESSYSHYCYEPMIVDQTGIKYNIDFTLKADTLDLNEVRKELNKSGLDIVKGLYEMNCIVVQDAK